MPAELLTGDPAPDFLAAAVGDGYPPEGQPVSLESLRGRRTVLFFFPHDDLPGSTGQLCAVRDAWDELRARVAVFGVSRDTPDDHRRLIARLALPFPLLSDADHRMARAYGVWEGDGGPGDVEGGASTGRATFILGPDRRVEAVLRHADPAQHARWLLQTLPR